MTNFSGRDHVLINTRERAVSTDINSLQERSARATSLTMQRQANDRYEWNNGRGVATELAANADPLNADVLGGLAVTVFSTHLLIDAGTLSVRATTSGFQASKDSDLIIVQSDGVTSSLILQFNANSDGVDVVECEVVELITSTENRDIYDPVTGLFTASLVTKAAEATLNFRIRQGASGTGFPGTVSGWLPLAIGVQNIVPTSFTDVDFYDVRPMVNERTSNPSRVGVPRALQLAHRCQWAVHETVPGTFFVSGNFYAPWGPGPDALDTQGGGYRLHGRIGPTLPFTDNDGASDEQQLEITNTDHWGAGITAIPGATRWAYLVSIQPFGLPRWCRYVGVATRVPGLTMGLYVLIDASVTGNLETSGVVSGVPLPTAYRLGAQTETGRVIACLQQTSSNTFDEAYCTDGLMRINGLSLGTSSASLQTVNGSTLEWEFDVGRLFDVTDTFLPGGTTGVELQAELGVDTSAASTATLTTSMETEGGAAIQGGRFRSYAQFPTLSSFQFNIQEYFTFPSEEFPNFIGPLGALGDISFHFDVLYGGAGANPAFAGTGTIRLKGVFFGWA